MVMPRLHTSHLAQYSAPAPPPHWITSGAIQYGVPTLVWRLASALLSWTQCIVNTVNSFTISYSNQPLTCPASTCEVWSAGHLARDAVVHELDLAVLGQQDVAPLHVAVEAEVLLQVEEGVQHLHTMQRCTACRGAAVFTLSHLLDDVRDLVLVEPPLVPGEGRGHVGHGAEAAQLHAVPHVPPHPGHGAVQLHAHCSCPTPKKLHLATG